MTGRDPHTWDDFADGEAVTEALRVIAGHCGRGPCWKEGGHEGPCEPGGRDDPRRVAEMDAGLVRVDSWKIVCQECRSEYEDYNGWTIFGEAWHAVESAADADWTVREGLVLCGSCGHRKVCMDEDRQCVRRDLTEADDGWMYCPHHIEQGMDESVTPPATGGAS